MKLSQIIPNHHVQNIDYKIQFVKNHKSVLANLSPPKTEDVIKTLTGKVLDNEIKYFSFKQELSRFSSKNSHFKIPL